MFDTLHKVIYTLVQYHTLLFCPVFVLKVITTKQTGFVSD